MDSSSVIITGGGGFVGRHLIAELQQKSSFSRILVFDTHVEHLPLGVEGYEVDITNPKTYQHILRDNNPAWIIHLAAVSSVGFAIDHPDITKTVNVFATEQLLEVSKKLGNETKFLIISSADIYGRVDLEIVPELPLSGAHPTNPYAQSKLDMEMMIEEKYNDRCIRVRPFPHIGPGQNKGFVTADFASQIAAIEKGDQDPVVSVGNLDAKRDFTDVRDVVRAYNLLLEKGRMGEVYHVASSQAHSISDVLATMLSMSSVAIEVSQDASRMRPSDTPILIGSAEKIFLETAWKPEISFETSLKDVLNDWRGRS